MRELRNFVEAAVAMGEPVSLDDGGIAPASRERAPFAAPPDLFELPYRVARHGYVAEFERRYLQRLIDSTGGNLAKAARRAEMNRSHLFHLLRRHGLR